MGNTIIRPLKTKAEHITNAISDKLNTDFDNNKQAIKSLNLPLSKSVTNKMAGYITRTKKKIEKKKKGN